MGHPIPEEFRRHPGGAPTKYKPEYCQDIVETCSRGHSLTGFAGKIGVCRDTLITWGKEHPEFFLAMKSAKAAATFGAEIHAERIIREGGGPGAASMTQFQLRNFADQDYKDKQYQTLMGPNEGPVQIENVTESAVDLIRERIASATARLENHSE